MAKRPLEFHSPKTPTKITKEESPTPLSPSKITTSEQHATISGLLTTLSAMKPSDYFEGEITDGERLMRLVGFQKHMQQQLQAFHDYQIPVTLRNCHIKQNRYKTNFEVILKDQTKIEQSSQQFNVEDLKTAGSSIINLSELPNLRDNERVTVRVAVLRVNEPQIVGGNKTKQEILVGDATAKATLVLWGTDTQSLQQGKSYQLNQLEIRTYLGKRQLSFPSTKSCNEISDLPDVVSTTSSDDDEDESLQLVSVSGVKSLETIYTCISCAKYVIQSNEYIGVCQSCQMTQKLPPPKQVAKLLVQTEDKRLSLKATDDALRQITQLQREVTAQDLLFSPKFNCVYNKYHTITRVFRN